LTAAFSPPRPMNAVDRLVQVGLQVVVAALLRPWPCNEHVVEVLAQASGIESRNECAQAPADPIADDGAADLLGNGESEACAGRCRRRCWAGAGLQNEGRRAPARAAPHLQELRSFFEG